MNTQVTVLLACSLSLPLAYADTTPSSSSTSPPLTYSLDFDPNKYTSKTLSRGEQTIHYRAYENLIYVQHPLDPQYQRMNIYIPEAYFAGKKMGDFTVDNAPIFLPNKIGAYMPAEPDSPDLAGGMGLPPMGDKPPADAPVPAEGHTANASFVALSKGYIVASPGARGSSNQDPSGKYIGKAPAAIVDLKAAVRYLRYNDKTMPGSAEKIISNGTSAGGALSALLGATGNNPDYAPYLKALGAADTSDAIFAVSAYCPITNLDHADSAYEWQLDEIHAYKKLVISKDTNYQIQRKLEDGNLTPEQIKLSAQLKALFPNYLNSLNLKDAQGNELKLDAQGNGNFKDLVKSYVLASAQTVLDKGQDLSKLAWLTIKDGKVMDLNFEQYLAYAGRMKTPPAFDALDLSNAENELFGNESVNAQHFTLFSQEHSTNKGKLADTAIVKLMNPMNYIAAPNTDTSKYWRIRHGTVDKDTSLAIPTILATRLSNQGFTVDFAMPWDQGHGGDYDLEALFAWMDQVTAH
ncbi:MAG: alpha/beta hydrolase [Thiothrix sp.]|nr:MAG: alpha/beta hydrolase [Thiothrix sp.]